MKASTLKKVLTEIQNGKRTWDNENSVSLLNSMMEHIGSIDSELRDNLIYHGFCQLILQDKLENSLLIQLMNSSLSGSFLFKGIGECETDSVFTRSFTTLLIALILFKDNKDNFLPLEMVYKIKDVLIQYITDENDLRGYVSDKGWAHSVAHVADAFDQLVKNRYCTQKFYLEILLALWKKIFTSKTVYIHGEDDRILTPILSMITKGLPLEEINLLIQKIPSELNTQKKELLNGESYWFLVANCNIILKSLYMRVATNVNLITIQKDIEICLKQI